MASFDSSLSKVEAVQHDTKTGVRTDLKAFYHYPEGHGYIVLKNGEELPFADEYQGVMLFAEISRQAHLRGKKNKKARTVKSSKSPGTKSPRSVHGF